MRRIGIVFLCLMGLHIAECDFESLREAESELLQHFEKTVEDELIPTRLRNAHEGARKIALPLLRKILKQGDILNLKTEAILNNEIEKLPITCNECAMAVGLLHVLDDKSGRDIITAVAKKICVTFKIESERVCQLAVKQFEKEMLYVVFHLSPKEVCYWLTSICPKPPSFMPEWKINTSPTPKPPLKPRRSPAPGAPTSKVLSFTDIHVDIQYKPGVDSNCGEPLCCRDNNPPAPDASEAAGYWGDYRDCDIPPWTFEGMLKNLSQYHFDFILFTGDIPAHDVWNQSRSDQIDRNNRFTQLMLKYFPETPVYASLGNHEPSPVNSYPPPQVANEPGGDIQWLYSGVVNNWKNWIPEKDLSSALQGGFYTTLIRKGLRVVSLNNNYCSDDSWWLVVGNYSVDPFNQLQWFVQVMQKAEENGEMVIILSHRPTDGCLESWSKSYYDIIIRYEDIIVAQYFGHAHTDELKLFYDSANSSRVSSVGFIGPGFTTYSYLNAGYRIYTFDGDYENSTHSIIDATSYYLNITEANLSHNPVWRQEYSFKQEYGMQSMFPRDFEDLMTRFSKDLNLFQRYHNHVTKDYNMGQCDAGCRDSAIRGIKKSVAG